MNKILFLIPFFINVFLFNGILRANNTNNLQTDIEWKGDISHFRFESQSVFELNNPKPQSTNVSYIAQSVDFNPAGFESALSLKLMFESSTTSFLRYWLVADQENLIKATAGYFIEVKDRRLQFFCRSEGVDRVLAKTPAGSLLMNPTDVSLSAVFKSDEVMLKYKKKGSSQEYTWGNIKIEPFAGGAFSGVVCYYPSGRAKSFYFRDWIARKIQILPPDPETAITLKSVEVISPNDLTIHFSEPVKTSQVVFQMNGSDAGIENLSKNDYTSEVRLSLATILEDGKHEISILNLNRENPGAKEVYNHSFIYEKDKPADPDEESIRVAISEIMANPEGVTGLPAVEYVELANISGENVNLKDWVFYYGDKAFKLPAYLLKPDSYVVLCGKSASGQLDSSVPKLYVPSFPVLANSGKLLYLEDACSRLQSVADYTDQWYGPGSNNSGCSLEKIDLYNQLSSALNWTASKAPRGGTPGIENSVSAANPDQINPELVSYEYLHPFAVRLRFNKPMNGSLLSDVRNYVPDSKLSVKSVRINYPLSDQVELILSDSLSEGECLRIEIKNLKCINSNLPETDLIFEACRSRPLQEKDILINELLYYPLKDEAEFIELYNNSNTAIDLSELYIATRKTDGSLQYMSRVSDTPFRLDKQQYLCVSKDIQSIRRVYDLLPDAICAQPEKLPQFSNSGGTVVLIYKSDKILDEFPYSPQLHTISSKNQQGVSLERKTMANPIEESGNWTSSFNPKGATPGYENSFKDTGTGAGNGSGKFRTDQKYFRPASLGYEQNWHLFYDLQDITHKVTIEIYAVNGVQVRALLRNKEIAGSGEMLWDGKDDNGSVLPIAPYVVYLQYFDAKSRLKKEKFVVTLTN